MRFLSLLLLTLPFTLFGADVSLPAPSPLAVRYYHTGIAWWIAGTLWNFFVPALFLVTGWSAKARRLADRIGGRWYYSFVVYFAIFLAYAFVMELPLSYFAGFVRQHAYGMSDQLLSKWAADSLKGFLVTLVMGATVLWVPYQLLRRAPERWWLITGLLAIPYFFFVMLIQPIWIAPLFNDFGPMKDKALEARILHLAQRAGVDAHEVFEVNKSVDTKRMNAYVTGFLGTKRIVLWDTLLKNLDGDQVLSVMGHEMGHFVLGHVVQGVLLSCVLTLLGLWLIHLSARGLLARHGTRWGFQRIDDFASLPLAILLIQFFSLLLTPVGLAYSRHVEHEADRFALEITRDNSAFTRTEAAFVEKDLAYPWPARWDVWLRYSHPPVGERFEFGRTYRPWETGAPLKYGNLFDKK